ncbi:ABC transporter permease [Paenibacillus sp.]|uniref:ABC transporter permease n=1 Tax=Paenibacillus sp. TaxID=58172 RepID=UPI002D370DA1|nr:ABC transporter permease [Paenibacillus sp.]HZG85311.1 ABC transporter permease [Paenibacillus sp.]
MRRVAALFTRICRQFLHDKRTLAMMYAAPLLILTLMSLLFNGDPYEPTIAAVDAPPALLERLENEGARAVEVSGAEEADALLASGEADAALFFADAGAPRLVLEGSNPNVAAGVRMFLSGAFAPPSADVSPPLEVAYLHGSEDAVSFDWFGPVLIGVFAFFFVFLIAGIAFLRERTGGTLERLLVSPLRRHEIVAGYVLGFGVFTLAQAGLIAWFAVGILDMVLAGSFGYVLLVTAALSVTALSLGIFLSAFAANEFQMIQFIPLVIVPQVFFCGLFPIDSLDPWLQWISYAMPLTYGADALREVMVRGGGWSDIAFYVYVLLGFSAVFMAANVLALRKFRKV